MDEVEVKTKLNIEKLLEFAERQELLEALDVIPVRNALLDLFGFDEPCSNEVLMDKALNTQHLNSAVPILEELLDYAAARGLMPENNVTYRDMFDARIMGLLMPRQSEIARRFWNMAADQSIEAATDDFYKLSMSSNYIRMDRIQKNKHWLTQTPYGSLEITINLSKPEKDPKEIAAERSMPQSNYPPCLLCVDNVGYAGRLNHPARQNHRIVPLKLSGEEWFLQYSPYVYYNEHSIVFKKEHVPMRISDHTFTRLLDYVEQFSHYFIGSNADLPIVGGSILNHDHFQAGKHSFPMELANIETTFLNSRYPKVKAGIVAWPMSVIRLSSSDKNQLAIAAADILKQWRAYNDPQVLIKAFSQVKGGEVPHNTITPIARHNEDGELELDLVLRNNQTSEEHPHGMFHPRQSLHHIKKENIGLIEVMGLAILPGRLLIEIADIVKILAGEIRYSEEMRADSSHPLFKHKQWIDELVKDHGANLSAAQAQKLMEQEVGHKFLQVLLDAGVYKRDTNGKEGFKRFMTHMGYEWHSK